MNAPASPPENACPAKPIKWRLIEYVDDGVYRIELASEEGALLNVTCRVLREDSGEGEVIELVSFDAREYGELMMRGLIHSMPICHAIDAFHKARSEMTS